MIDENILTQRTLSEYGFVHSSENLNLDIKNLCWKAFWVNLGLAVFKILIGSLKITAGTMGYSQLLIIDGLCSAANAIIISMILFGIYMSRPLTINESYPYGKGKAQYISSLLVGALLAVSAAFILAIAIKTFLIPMNLEPVGIGMSVGLISISSNILLIRYIQQSGIPNKDLDLIIRFQKINILASFIVCNSLLFTGLLGWFFMERIGSLSISFIVVALSFRIIKQSLDGIMDRSSGKELESFLTEKIYQVDGVQNVDCVRTRYAGQNLCIDVRLAVNAENTIRQTDSIDREVRKKISKDLSQTNHVMTVDCFPA
ncbi:magnetosome protein MamMB, greigite-specific [Candidatus Magnetomorum sp. HK-1]|nr:magnetosome protein MamMB, greigite-specific [Candidatus Magnetomorum sp. HK-1]